MDSLKFTKDEIDRLELLSFIPNHVESDIYLYKEFIIKKYIWDDSIKFERLIRENKIERLADINVQGLILPKYKLEVDGIFEGCVSTYIKEGINFSNMKNVRLKKKIELYKRASMIMKEAHDNGIILCDVNPNNILYDDKLNVYYCDVDSSKIDNIHCIVLNARLFYNPNLPDNIQYTKATDIFLLNNMFLDMITNKRVGLLKYNKFVEQVDKLGWNNELDYYFKNIYDMGDKTYFHDISGNFYEEQIRRMK